MDDINSNPDASQLICVGLSHHTTDLALRETIHVPPKALPAALEQLRDYCKTASVTPPDVTPDAPLEAVILSTCNRFEVYSLYAPGAIAGWIAGRAPQIRSELDGRLTTRLDKETVRHLFSVAGGLEAQVVGETQILGQVKDAYETARHAGMTGHILNLLFQRALAVGKRIRTETKLAETPVSVSSVAVRLCEKIFDRLAGRQVLVVGAGEISCLAAEHLFERGAHLTIFSTRSREPAEALAASVSASCLPIESMPSHLADADIVISGSGAPHLLLPADAVRNAQKIRRGRPLFLVDLAVPRNIDPAAAALENVFLYNLDDLDDIARDHRREREKEIPQCERIIQEEADAFWDRMNEATLEEPLRRFHARISGVVEQELRRSGLSGDSLETLKNSIPNRILSEAFKRSRGEFAEQDRQTLLRALKEFFGL